MERRKLIFHFVLQSTFSTKLLLVFLGNITLYFKELFNKTFKMKITKTLLFFICLALYYFFFWEEEFGLNLLIFNSILLIYNYSQMPKNKKTYLLILSGFFSSLSVVLINTSFNKIVNILIMAVVFGYQLLPTINSAFSAGLIYSSNIIRNIKYLGAPFSQTIEGMAPKSVILEKSLKVLDRKSVV